MWIYSLNSITFLRETLYTVISHSFFLLKLWMIDNVQLSVVICSLFGFAKKAGTQGSKWWTFNMLCLIERKIIGVKNEKIERNYCVLSLWISYNISCRNWYLYLYLTLNFWFPTHYLWCFGFLFRSMPNIVLSNFDMFHLVQHYLLKTTQNDQNMTQINRESQVVVVAVLCGCTLDPSLDIYLRTKQLDVVYSSALFAYLNTY